MNRLFIATVAAAAAGLAACTAQAPQVPSDPKLACESLKGMTIAPDRIVWPGLTSGRASVDSATWMPPAPLQVAAQAATPAAAIQPATPAFCKVLGRIAPVDPKADPILFQVNLPDQWNGRSVQFGGGGFNGVLISGLGLVPGAPYDKPAPLARGYVTVGTDSGHQNRPGVSPMAFALNDEMLENFAHASYPKVRNVSVEIMRKRYARHPEFLYFVGSSEGGREGLVMAQRYPEAFNGIFSRVPVINWTGLQFAGVRNGLALMDGGWLNPAQVKLVHEATLAACDMADGQADRIVSNAQECLQTFDPAKLRCVAGQQPDTCLSDKQIAAIRTLRSPYRFPYPLANGVTEYPGWGIGGEDTPASGPTGGWRAWWTGNSAPTVPVAPGAGGIAWTYGVGALQHFYARDPNADPRRITPESVADRVRQVSALMDATNPDLTAFMQRKNKLIMMEYLSDYAQSPYAGVRYFEAVQRRMSPRQVAEFMRLYAAPGVDHVGTGAPALVDMLDVLSTWTEKGHFPVDLIAMEQDAKPPFATLRSRPLCQWPRWPRYGSGNPVESFSYGCYF